MNWKKLCSAVLAAAMALALGMPTSAASYSASPGNFVDENGYIVDHDALLAPGATYYYIVGNTTDYGILTDKSYLTFSLKKTSNSRYITDAALVEKRFGGDRMVCIRFSVKDYFTSDEYKVQMEASFRARVDLTIANPADVVSGIAFPIFVPKSNAPAAFAARMSTADLYKQASEALAAAKQTVANLEASLASLGIKLGETPPYKANTAALTDAQNKYNEALAAVHTLNAQVAQQAESVWLLENNPDSDKLPPEKVAELTNRKNELAAQIEGVKAHLRALGIVPDTYATSIDPLDAQKLLPYYNNVVAKEQGVKDSGAIPPSFTFWNALRTNYLLTYLDDAMAIPALQVGRFSYLDAAGQPKVSLDNRPSVVSSLVNLRANLKTSIDNANYEIAGINNQLSGKALMAYSVNIPLAQAQAKLEQLKNEQAAANSAAASANTRAVNYAAFNRDASALVDKQTEVLTLQADYDYYKKQLEIETANTPGVSYLNAGQTFTKYFTIWIGNESVSGDDTDFDVGQSGQVIRPVKNAVNTIRWNDGYGTIASVSFTADSDASFFCPRLSTRWDNADYADYFSDQDAYLFDFKTNPTLPATSRANLRLRNPFVDDNGRPTIRPRDIEVYQINNGYLTNVTGLFDPTVDDDGVSVLSTRTRTLGTYIVCEKAVSLPDDDDDDYDYDDDIEILDPTGPVIPAVDINNNQKPVPNTGR